VPSMIIHDIRLRGKTPTRYNYVMQVNKNTPVEHIIGSVTHYGRMHKLSCLHIACHGYEANWNLRGSMCTPEMHGGFGLQLGYEGLSLFNATKTSAWKGYVDLIVLFACAPADVGPGNEGTEGDGRRLLGELSLWSGARVVGARDTQFYNDASGKTTIDFGDWEGPVYEFSPDTPYGRIVDNPSRIRLLG